MKTVDEVYQELLAQARQQGELAQQQAGEIYAELLGLCLLANLAETSNADILQMEERYRWENRNELVHRYELAMLETDFWNRRLQVLQASGLTLFRERYGDIRDPGAFIHTLEKALQI